MQSMGDDSAGREERLRKALERSLSRSSVVSRRPDPGAPAPVSRFQEGLWYNALLAREAGRASEPRPAAFRLVGPLDLDALTAAVHRVQERHAVLRTIFPAREDAPTQVVTDGQADVEFHDVSAVTEESRLDEARRLARALALTPFDLEHEPPFRPHIIKLDTDDHLLVVAMHHLIFDGWSANILRWELEEGYAAACGLADERDPPIDLDVADLAAWERSREDPDAVNEQLEYWRHRLEGIEGELDLPREHRAPSGDSAVSIEFELEPEVMARFTDLARSLDATPFMMLLAASEILAARLSQQADFVVGVATSGRTNPAFDRHIGCFINMMLVRAQLSDETTFAEAVSAARAEVLGGLANQQAPFSRIVADHRHSPIQAPFNLLVQMRSFPTLPEAPSTGLEWTPFDLEMPSGVALTIEGRHHGSGVRVFLTYNSDVFGPETIRRWSGHLHRLIRSAVESPDASVWDLEMLATEEREQVIHGFNEPNIIGTPSLVSERLAAMADAHPTLVAYDDGERALSYRELVQEASGFAERVRRLGAGRGTRIVLYMESGLDAAVAVVGALWSGAAYVPVDPAVSASWLVGIVEETDPAVVITHGRLIGELANLAVPTVAFEDVAGPVMSTIPLVTQPQDVAYVSYTSGSTGAPKGVVITQGNLAAVLENQTYCRYGPGSRVMQVYSIAFDGYVTGLLGPLVNGATAVLHQREALGSAVRFLRWCDDAGITHMAIPTSLFHTVVDEMSHDGLSFPTSLEHVAIGGEEVRPDAVETFYALRRHEVRLHNTYGPTETTVWVLRKDLSIQADGPFARVPIGTPVPNAWVYVFDGRGRPTPVGVEGELHIGGSQVGLGYFGRPDLTADRFVADPFSDHPDARVYRTGDLARWLPDGEVEFLGRIDRQVKIRGFRVEPGAVETVLRGHPAVADAAVVDAIAPNGSATLRAYVVASGSPPSESELRSWCRASLPELTVPSSFTLLDQMPRTVSRKLDRARLPEPEPIDAPHAERDPITEAIAGIWCDVLGLEEVPAGGDFFALGGHSLFAMRVIGRVRSVFDVEVPLTTLFDSPTIEDFASVIAADAVADWRSNELDDLLAGLAELEPEEAAALLAAIDPDGGA